MATSQKTQRYPSTTAANIAGTLGYLSVLLQWTWTLLLLCYPLLASDHSILFPQHPVHPVHTENQALATSPIGIFAALIVTAFILVLTVLVLTKLPRAIGKRGSQITQQTANVVVPIMVRHKPLSKAKRRKLSYRIILTVKLLAIVLPLVGLIFAQPVKPLTSSVMWIVGLYCALWSVLYFAVQLAVAVICKVDRSRLW